MKFLIDAQLPPSLAKLLNDKGHNAIHTLSPPEKNLSSDKAITAISLREERIVITKDADFYHSFLIRQEPYKLLLIRTGNLSKYALNSLIISQLDVILRYFTKGSMIELTKEHIKLLY